MLKEMDLNTSEHLTSSFLENVGACTSTPIHKGSGCSIFNSLTNSKLSRKRKETNVRDEFEADFKAKQIHHSIDSHVDVILKSTSDTFSGLTAATSSSVIINDDSDSAIKCEKSLVEGEEQEENNGNETLVIVNHSESETLENANEYFTISQTYCTDTTQSLQLSNMSSVPIMFGDDGIFPFQEISNESVLFDSETFLNELSDVSSVPIELGDDRNSTPTPFQEIRNDSVIFPNQPAAYIDECYQRPAEMYVNATRMNTCKSMIVNKKGTKRMVIIDGSNVAFAHSSERKEFSVEGIEICINYFVERGHEVKAVVPQMRLKRSQSTNSFLLEQLKDKGKLIITPCKNFPNGKSLMSYDDRFILEIAFENDAVVISNDNYRDLFYENEKYKTIIENRVIGYTFCNDSIYLPTDPYGKNGPLFHEILTRQVK